VSTTIDRVGPSDTETPARVPDNIARHESRRQLSAHCKAAKETSGQIQHQTHGRANHGLTLRGPCPVGDRYHKEES